MTHYLDHAATSPLFKCARDAWLDAQNALSVEPGNPASLHSGGRHAKRMLEDARERIGACLGAQRAEVVLVSGATESDALAVTGAARAQRALAPSRTRVWISEVEHDAVAEQAQTLRDEGFEVCPLAVSSRGVVEVDSESLSACAASVAVASLTLVSSEIGTIQPVERLVEAFADEVSDVRSGGRALVHTDAAQAVGVLDLNFSKLGVDLLTVGGHKIGAPVGTGVLLVKRGTPVRADRRGGGHERGLRSGTPDVAGACALAAALEETVRERETRRQHLLSMRALLVEGLPALSEALGAPIRLSVAPELASPAIIHLSVPTWHPEAVLMAMDAAGVAISAGSACHSGVTRPSAIRLAMGATEAEALGALRVSTGPSTSRDDIVAFLEALPRALSAARALDEREGSRVASTLSRRV